MPAEIIDGRKIALEIQGELKQRISRLQEKGVSPKLVAILVGEDPPSLSYLRGIARSCAEVGVLTETVKLAENVTQKELMEKIGGLNRDSGFMAFFSCYPCPNISIPLRRKAPFPRIRTWMAPTR